MSLWFGVYARTGASADAGARLREALQRATESAAFCTQLHASAWSPARCSGRTSSASPSRAGALGPDIADAGDQGAGLIPTTGDAQVASHLDRRGLQNDEAMEGPSHTVSPLCVSILLRGRPELRPLGDGLDEGRGWPGAVGCRPIQQSSVAFPRMWRAAGSSPASAFVPSHGQASPRYVRSR